MLLTVVEYQVFSHDSEICNDPFRRYDITTLNREKFQFLNENSVNLLMKNESNFFSIYIHQTTRHYLSEYTHTHTHIYIYRNSNSVHIIHIMENKFVHTYN